MWFPKLSDGVTGRGLRGLKMQRRRGGLTKRPIATEPLETRVLPAAATLTIGDATIVEGHSGVKHVEVVVSLTAPRGGNGITVDYQTVSGTATAGSDYSSVSSKLTFAKNETIKKISVPVMGDRTSEFDEQFSIVLSNVKGGAKLLDNTAVVTIQNDDPLISISDAWGYEGNSGTTPFKFTISLSTASDVPVTVNYKTASGTATDGSDYSGAMGSVTFAVGETSKDISVDVIGDTEFESYETFFVNLTSTDAQFDKSQGSGYIYDDEPYIDIYDAYYDDYYSGSGATQLTFWVYLSNTTDDVVTVDYTTVDFGSAVAGVDFIPEADTLIFQPGDWYQTITIDIPAEHTWGTYFGIELSNASNNSLINWGWAYGILDYYYYY